jgi:hypothetical protein
MRVASRMVLGDVYTIDVDVKDIAAGEHYYDERGDKMLGKIQSLLPSHSIFPC